MTQAQLKTLFETLYENYDDTLDVLLELGKHQEEYEDSEFKKVTQLSIFDAYSLYMRSGFLFKQLFDILQKVIDRIDYTTLNNNLSLDELFKEIPEEYSGLLKQIISEYSVNSDEE